MKKMILFLVWVCLVAIPVMAQKKPLDHSVYDGWQNIGEKLISHDGKWIVYTIDVQEGDNELVIQSADGSYKKTIARGDDALITGDSRYVIFKIKPFFKDTRDARIKKKKPEEMPKDSLAIVELGKDNVWKVAKVKSYKAPEKSFGWVAYHLEKPNEPAAKGRPASPDSKKLTDSLTRVIDSLQQVIASIPKKKSNKDNGLNEGDDIQFPTSNFQSLTDADGDEASPSATDAGTDLILRNIDKKEEKTFRNVVDYVFSEKGRKLLIEQSRNPKDSLSKATVLLYDLQKGFADTLSRGGNDFKNFVISKDGAQVAYVAERDAKPKSLEKFYKLWYYKEGMDSATMLIDKTSTGMKLGMTVSEFGTLTFSKSGKRLLFGTAPIQPPKDTTLVEMDLVKLDVWHYKDDYLQTVQLNRLQRDLQINYLAVYDLEDNRMTQLGSEEIPQVYPSNEGDGETFAGVTDFGKRIESQWTGNTRKDVYAIQVKDGSKKLLKKDLLGFVSPNFISPSGKYIMWYDSKAKNYFVNTGDSARNITAAIKVPIYNEENDSPTEPGPYGVMGWHEGDSAVYIYDRFDIWKIDVAGKQAPKTITSQGRATKNSYRYVRVDDEERFVKSSQPMLLRRFNETTKEGAIVEGTLGSPIALTTVSEGKYSYGALIKAENSENLLYTKENYTSSPDLYIHFGESSDKLAKGGDGAKVGEEKLSSINPQQKNYNWGTAELYKWKTFTGKPSEGILYKPEDFDPTKKYPLILYFYEKLSDGLYTYQAPSPTPSRLNISFFVSRGYLVFAPDITYTIGHPAKSAYDYIVSAAKDLAKNKWVDEKNLGIQGQSWGGIQVAQLVTMTDMFKAAWAGAPVANMTSAYGGIRWESGVTRQFQYEKTQSRIGATLWEKPELYIESSPLFHLPKVKTPLVIMSNDADGAVPWYQGIELFTGMRRLGKQVWMLNYNGEAHNLVQRRNRKDIQIREQQYFDWLLKGAKPARWITDGVPAVKKGKEWGLEVE